MDNCVRIQNGFPIYLINKLLNDFDTLYCQAIRNSIYFIGVRNYIYIELIIFNKFGIFPERDYNWDYSYAFKSSDLKGQLGWFGNKANSNKKELLNIMPSEHYIEINSDSDTFEAKLESYIEKPTIPRIPIMSNGIVVTISNLKGLVDRIKAIADEIINLRLFNSTLVVSGLTHPLPAYKIPLMQDFENEEKSTQCWKPMLRISCQLVSELGKTELRFYPGGAIQLSSKSDYMSARCLLTTIQE